MPRYTAVLDACVLVPIALADTLLRVAEKGLYRPLWSGRILAEAQAATEEIHPGIDAGKRFAQMREAFADALVTGWEELEPAIRLPDPDDRHVVAAAAQGGAQAIITANVKDFPAAALRPLGLEAVHPGRLPPRPARPQPAHPRPGHPRASRPHQEATTHPAGPRHPARPGRRTRLRRRGPPPHGRPPGRHLTREPSWAIHRPSASAPRMAAPPQVHRRSSTCRPRAGSFLVPATRYILRTASRVTNRAQRVPCQNSCMAADLAFHAR